MKMFLARKNFFKETDSVMQKVKPKISIKSKILKNNFSSIFLLNQAKIIFIEDYFICSNNSFVPGKQLLVVESVTG